MNINSPNTYNAELDFVQRLRVLMGTRGVNTQVELSDGIASQSYFSTMINNEDGGTMKVRYLRKVIDRLDLSKEEVYYLVMGNDGSKE